MEEERKEVMMTILASGHFPIAMEFFGAVSDSSIDAIKKYIEESDCFIIITKARYGDISLEFKKSFCEFEYDYAIEMGKPILAFLFDREKVALLPRQRENLDKLKAFEKKLKSSLRLLVGKLLRAWDWLLLRVLIRYLKTKKNLKTEAMCH
jgi:hypothetical protein